MNIDGATVEFEPINPLPFPQIKEVLGMSKDFINEFLINYQNADTFRFMGIAPTKTYLLEGVPGTGKSMGINAINNTVNKNVLKYIKNGKMPPHGKGDFNLMCFEYSIAKYGTAYINRSSRIMGSFFDQLFFYSNFGPVLAVFDECDALLGKRTGQNHSEDRKVLETFMTKMQILHDTPNMYAALMTNCPDICDDASLRAGRIDKRYRFDLPSEEERKIAFSRTIRKINAAAKKEQKAINQTPLFLPFKGKYNMNSISKKSDGLNYADIQCITEEVVRDKTLSLIKDPENFKIAKVTQGNLEQKIEEHKGKYHPPKKTLGFTAQQL